RADERDLSHLRPPRAPGAASWREHGDRVPGLERRLAAPRLPDVEHRGRPATDRGPPAHPPGGGGRVRHLAAGRGDRATAGRAGATVITAFPVDFAVNEQSAFNGAVATFEDDNPDAAPADFTASIDWGDGSAPTAGTIGSSSGAFVVLGQHTYADEGAF